MKIVIVDNDMLQAEEVKKEVLKYYEDAEITIFTRLNMDFIKNNMIDVLFLDIDLGCGLNGIEEAIKLRNKIEYNIDIVFVSNYDNFVFNSFRAMPLNFIRKSDLEYGIHETIKCLRKRNNHGNATIVTKNNIIRVQDILYIESKLNYVHYMMIDNEKIIERDKLSNLESELSKYQFIRCQRSFIINPRYIARKMRDDVIMEDGSSIHITRNYVHSFKDKYLQYRVEENTYT